MNKSHLLFLTSLIVLTCASVGAQPVPKLSDINFLVSGQSVDSTSFADVTVELKFDTDMDSSKSPVVKFGLAEPFQLTLPKGSGWLDRRLWQGFFTVSPSNPTSPDGQYIFKVYDAEDVNKARMDTTLSTALGKTLYICRSGIMTLSNALLDFGRLRFGGDAMLPLVVSNASCVDLNVTSIAVTPPFYLYQSDPSVFSVAPRQSREIHIRFDPFDRADYNGSVTITSDDGRQPVQTVQLQGTAFGSRIAIIPKTPMNFGKVPVGNDSSITVRVTNLPASTPGHDENLIISSIAATSPVYTATPSSMTISPGDSQQVTVTFIPTLRVLYNLQRLNFAHNDLTQRTFIVLNGDARDENPPGSVVNLTPQWSGFNGFVRSPALSLCWQNPDDPSGIAEIWWKFATGANPPTSANDTTQFGGRLVLTPGATCASLGLSRLFSGYWNCYVWLVDGSGNSGYANAVRTSFIYDINPPGIPKIQARSIPGNRWFTSSSSFDLTLAIPLDKALGVRDASEIRWKYQEQPADPSDYDGNLVFTDPNPATRTLTFPFQSQELCGDDSLYLWLVDSAGNSSADNFEIARYRFDICPPVFERTRPDTDNVAILGNVYSDTLKITDSVGVDTVWARYRFGGANAEEPSRPMRRLAGTDLYTVEIPVAGVTRRGVEVRAVALDSLGNRGEAPDQVCDVVAEGENQPWFPIRTRIEAPGDFRVDSDGNPVPLTAGDDSTMYQLFSVPYVLDSSGVMTVLQDDLGKYDNRQWRFFDYVASRPEGQRYLEGDQARAFTPGRSYFIISRQPNIVVDSGPGMTVRTVCSDSIRVYDGWNLIATPYNFPVSRESLSLVNSETIISLRSFERGWNIVDTMQPWKGYALFVSKPSDQSAETPMYLVVRPKAAAGRLSKLGPQLTPASGEWDVRISAKAAGLRDSDNWAGVRQAAKSGYDRLELAEPPVIGGYLKVSFPHREWNLAARDFSTDFRPAGGDEQVWEFEVASNLPRKQVTLDFDFAGDFPATAEAFVVDEALHLSQNLKGRRSYTFTTGSHGLRKHLKLIVGGADFAQAQAGEIGLVPERFALLQNFPNPFNPETRIRYNLPEAGSVTLEVFDLLGRRVNTLVSRQNQQAGFHLVNWNGRDDRDRPVASGVYLYRLRAAGKSVVCKMILMR